jgi:hypothetical protein
VVADQKPQRTTSGQAYVPISRRHGDHEVRLLHTGSSSFTDRHSPVMEAAMGLQKKPGAARPIFCAKAEPIPVVALMQDFLHAPVVLMGFGLPDDGAHALTKKRL